MAGHSLEQEHRLGLRADRSAWRAATCLPRGRQGGGAAPQYAACKSSPSVEATSAAGSRTSGSGPATSYASPPEGFASNAEFIKSKTGGATAKAFNINFMALLGRVSEARAKPSNMWCGDEETREVVEQLTRDAGYEPVYAGGVENAAHQEAYINLVFAIAQGGLGPFLYRMAPPDQL